MKQRACLLLLLCLASALWLCGCTATQHASAPLLPSPAAATPVTNVPATGTGSFSVRVDALDQGALLPEAYTCKGAFESPELSWENIPKGTKSLVMILDDPDAPKETFTHWLLYNIPPTVHQISRAQSRAKVLENGAQQGDNSAGSRGYFPPCPPYGQVHRYIFTLYSLDYEITMPAAGRESIDRAMNGHVIGQTKFTTTFVR